MRRSRWIVVGFAVLAIVLGILANAVEQHLQPYGPTSVSGAVGDDVRTFPFQLHVNAAVAAEAVVEDGFDGPTAIDTDGVWVVVDLSYASVDQLQTPFEVTVRDGAGREFPISPRADTATWAVGPDIWQRGNLAFEVAPDALESLSLVFGPITGLYGPMPNTYAVVPLELQPDAVQEVVELVEVEPLAVGER